MDYTGKRPFGQKHTGAFSSASSHRCVSMLCLLLIVAALPAALLLSNTQTQRYGHAAGGNEPQIGGCQVFPSDNVWNADISALPVNPNSAKMIAYLGASNTSLTNYFGTWGGIPYTIVPGSQTFVPVNFHRYPEESDPGPYPIPPTASVERGSDHHLLVVDSGNCKAYELWGGVLQSDHSWVAGSGAIWDFGSDQLKQPGRASADAGGFSLTAGLVRYDEVAAGAINHAIRVVIQHPQNGFIWPATHTDGDSTDPYALPEGTRLRLKASVAISSFSPANRVILTALKKYGMIIADKGPDPLEISGAPDSRWDDADLMNLSRLHASDFEVVDESPLQVSATSGRVAALATATPTPTPGATTTPAPTTSVACAGPTITAQLTLDTAAVTPGATITGTVTYTNTCSTPIAMKDVVIAGRTSTGGNADFTPDTNALILQPDQTQTLSASRTIRSTDPPGQWSAFASYQDSSNTWHAQTTTVYFTVTQPAPTPAGRKKMH